MLSTKPLHHLHEPFIAPKKTLGPSEGQYPSKALPASGGLVGDSGGNDQTHAQALSSSIDYVCVSLASICPKQALEHNKHSQSPWHGLSKEHSLELTRAVLYEAVTGSLQGNKVQLSLQLITD